MNVVYVNMIVISVPHIFFICIYVICLILYAYAAQDMCLSLMNKILKS